MALKKAKSKPAAKKAPAKKANAPMKNTAKAKPAKTVKKAVAKKAAKSAAKTAKPAVRKSAAKRVEKAAAKKAAPMSLAKQLQVGDIAVVRKQMNKIVSVLKADFAAAKGAAGEKKFREMVLAVSRAVANTKKKQGVKYE